MRQTFKLRNSRLELERLNHLKYISKYAEKLEILTDELDKAEKCIYDVETYLQLGNRKFIKTTIDRYRGLEGQSESEKALKGGAE